MTPRELPSRPSLEQLKNQAKSLLRGVRSHEAAALHRFSILPAFAAKREIDPAGLALHDAQSVIAREHGFASWSALREEVEARTLSFDAAVDEFVRSASGGAARRAERLLTLRPAIATATLQAALVLGDFAAVEERLEGNPALVSRPGGPHEWEPLLYVCHTCLHEIEPARANGLVEIARRLCALGANPDATYQWHWHPELPRTALWGAICAVRHLPLAEALLEAGAHPTDGVSAHIAASVGDLAALDLLHRYGVNADGIPGGVPPLVYRAHTAAARRRSRCGRRDVFSATSRMGGAGVSSSEGGRGPRGRRAGIDRGRFAGRMDTACRCAFTGGHARRTERSSPGRRTGRILRTGYTMPRQEVGGAIASTISSLATARNTWRAWPIGC